jgi:hypothetical protein
VSDADSMEGMLISAFGFDAGESKKLTDKQATSNNIRTALQTILSKSAPGDVACFYHSGHGSRVPAVADQADCDSSIRPGSKFIAPGDIFHGVHHQCRGPGANRNIR